MFNGEISAIEEEITIHRDIYADKENFKNWFIKTYYSQFNEIPSVNTVDVVTSLKRKRSNMEKYFAEILSCISVVLYQEDLSHKIFDNTRKQEIAIMRKMVSYIMVKKLKFSVSGTARLMGKNHATVIHHCKSMSDILEVDAEMRNKYKFIEVMLVKRKIFC